MSVHHTQCGSCRSPGGILLGSCQGPAGVLPWYCRGPAKVLPGSCLQFQCTCRVFVWSAVPVHLPSVCLVCSYSAPAECLSGLKLLCTCQVFVLSAVTVHLPSVCLVCSYCATAECLSGHTHIPCTFVLVMYAFAQAEGLRLMMLH